MLQFKESGRLLKVENKQRWGVRGQKGSPKERETRKEANTLVKTSG